MVATSSATTALYVAITRLNDIGRRANNIRTAADATRLLRSINRNSTDELVDTLATALQRTGVSEAALTRIGRLLKSVPDALGGDAFALTVVYSVMLMVVRADATNHSVTEGRAIEGRASD